MVLMPQYFLIWLITRVSQTHSSEASYSAIISEWLVEATIKVYLDDCQEMAAPAQSNINLLCDFAL